jgi:hypothetical protein
MMIHIWSRIWEDCSWAINDEVHIYTQPIKSLHLKIKLFIPNGFTKNNFYVVIWFKFEGDAPFRVVLCF